MQEPNNVHGQHRKLIDVGWRKVRQCDNDPKQHKAYSHSGWQRRPFCMLKSTFRLRPSAVAPWRLVQRERAARLAALGASTGVRRTCRC
jgi:hypothetical protein